MNKEVLQKVFAHYHEVERDYNVFGTMLYGSQNYGVALPESDVDVKTMILPSFDSIVFDKQRVAIDKRMPDSSINNIKDYRDMFDNYLKGNINFLETLYTPYFMANPNHLEEFVELQKNRDLIANSCPQKTMIIVSNLAESNAKKITGPDYNFKHLMHIVRLYIFMRDFYRSMSFGDSIYPTENTDFLLDFRINKRNWTDAQKVKSFYLSRIKDLADNNCLPKEYKRKEAEEFIHDLTIELFKKIY